MICDTWNFSIQRNNSEKKLCMIIGIFGLKVWIAF